jgi:hypothetical protein
MHTFDLPLELGHIANIKIHAVIPIEHPKDFLYVEHFDSRYGDTKTLAMVPDTVSSLLTMPLITLT